MEEEVQFFIVVLCRNRADRLQSSMDNIYRSGQVKFKENTQLCKNRKERMQCFSVECTTYCLQGLEEAVENQVPDDLPVLKGRDIPDEKVAEHGQRCGQHDPTGERQRQTETETERERITTKHGVRNM